MPCSDNRKSLDDYSAILQEISDICTNNETNLLIIGGDWNADPSRNDGRTKLFKDHLNSFLMILMGKRLPYEY